MSQTSRHATFQISLKVIVKKTSGEMLLLKAISKGSMPGYYDFPGGRIGRNERGLKLEDIILREVRQELGEKVKIKLRPKPATVGRHYYWFESLHKEQPVLWLLFEGKYLGGTITLSKEHEGFIWKKISKRNYKKYFTKGALTAMNNYLTNVLE